MSKVQEMVLVPADEIRDVINDPQVSNPIKTPTTREIPTKFPVNSSFIYDEDLGKVRYRDDVDERYRINFGEEPPSPIHRQIMNNARKNRVAGAGNELEVKKNKGPRGRPKTSDVHIGQHDKIKRILVFSLKLAKIGGYNESGELVLSGKTIKGSNISKLIVAALSPSLYLKGTDEFITLLSRVDIDPSIIVNQYIRSKLTGVNMPQIAPEDIPLPHEDDQDNEAYNINTYMDVLDDSKKQKRKISDSDEEQELSEKHKKQSGKGIKRNKIRKNNLYKLVKKKTIKSQWHNNGNR